MLASLLAATGIPAASAAGRLPLTGPRTELVLGGGHVRRVTDPYLPSSGPPRPAARTALTRRPVPNGAVAARARSTGSGPTVPAALAALRDSGAITADQYRTYSGYYSAARSSLTHLLGTRRLELGAVLANVAQLAAAGQFIPSRLPVVFGTLERNRQWWTTGPLLSNGQRIGFAGSRVVWEYYAGQGVQIQWLGTFGKANGYYLSRNNNGNLSALLSEVLPLATQRAGGIAWEYMFKFDGGAPPWTSGLSQGTAIQALARAGTRLHNQAFLTGAQQALGIFQVPPPEGVRVATPAGVHYLEYSYAPREYILNGFIQALVGLYDYARLTGDPLGQQLFAAGDAEARVETPQYDTGAWSLYDQSSESDLSYHDLLRDFLTNLCQRVQTPLPQPASGSGGSTAPPAQGPGADQIYCQTAQHFTAYLHVAPVLSLLTKRAHGGHTVRLRFALSKISNVAITVRHGGRVVYSAHELAGHGTPSFSWPAPRHSGSYAVALAATDLAGNHGSASGSLALSAPPARHGHSAAGTRKRP